MLLKNYLNIMFLCLLFMPVALVAQNVAINNDGAEPDMHAILDLNSKSKGLLIPRMDSNARKAIPNTIGLLLYDTDTHSFWYNDGSKWRDISTGSGWLLGGNTGTNTATHFIGTSDNAMLAIRVNNQPSGLIDFSMSNTFWGYQSGLNTSERSNTGIGAWALSNNNVGAYNTALGSRAMFQSTTGLDNTAIGAEALMTNVDGSYNTAVGSIALHLNSSGNFNTAIGFSALHNSTASNNTAVGFFSQFSNTTGDGNTSVGSESMRLNTTGIRNTAVGAGALHENTGGYDNAALGMEALFLNTTGFHNVAVGKGCLRSNTSGSRNTVVGYQAMISNIDGENNTAVGIHTLMRNTSGVFNTVMGFHSMIGNVDGNYNVAVGYASLEANTSGSTNTAVGGAGLFTNTTGVRNSAVGYAALAANTVGSSNTAIGYAADMAVRDLNNATAIGAQAVVNTSNKVRIGNAAVTVIEGQVPFTTPSDGRFKFNVQEDVKGLDFILQLRPVTYQFNVEQYDAQWKNTGSKSDIPRRSITEDNARIDYSEALHLRRTGFIAQEVEKAAITSKFNFSGIIKPKTAGEHYSLSYESFVVPLVKAVQEQQEIIRELQQQVAELRLLIKKAN